ncbi:MAG: C10 family peptidase [Bacteroidales bacterium]|nr:C10 family peptidase [Bacteroidales bacterium]
MKRLGILLFTITFSVVSFLSCSKTMSYVDPTPINRDVFLRFQDQTKTVISNDYYTLDEDKIAAYVKALRPEVIVENTFALYDGDRPLVYVYNYNQGCEVFASDKRMQPSLAYDEKGSLTLEDFEEEPLSSWLDMVKEEVHILNDCKDEVVNEYTDFWRSFLGKNIVFLMNDSSSDSIQTKSVVMPEHSLWVKQATGMRQLTDTTTLVRVPKLTSTSWGREEPWNYYAPYDSLHNNQFINSSAAVASSQLVYYHNKVNNSPLFFKDLVYIMIYGYIGRGEHIGFMDDRCHRVNNSPKWNNMALSAQQGDTSSLLLNVSELIVHSDAAMITKYTYKNNPYYLAAVHPEQSAAVVFNEYGLQNSTMTYNRDTVISNLCSGMPVYGKKSDTAWLFDAFRSIEYTYLVEYQWLRQPDPDGQLWPYETGIDTGSPEDEHYDGELTYEEETVINKYFQLNWGLDGYKNSLYVTIDSSGSWSGGSGYSSSGASIIFNVRP